MEKHFFITGTSKEIDFLALYSKKSTPKLWGKEKRIKDNIYKYEVNMRLSDDAQIENGKTYSFNNYLKRTNDLSLQQLIKDFDVILENYKNN